MAVALQELELQPQTETPEPSEEELPEFQGAPRVPRSRVSIRLMDRNGETTKP